jgi:hypothetical protein
MFDGTDYYAQRAESERRLADEAQDPRAAHAHRRLAELHDEAQRRQRPGGGQPSMPMSSPQRF